MAFQVHQLAVSLLDTHIDRIIHIRPMHLIELGWQYSRTPLSDEPEGRPYTPLQTGQLIWAEGYRAVRARRAYDGTTLALETNGNRSRVLVSPIWLSTVSGYESLWNCRDGMFSTLLRHSPHLTAITSS